MRVLALLLLLLPLAPEAQVAYAVSGPETIELGAPLVLNVTATLTEPGSYPEIELRGVGDADAATVRRASGETVPLEHIMVVCGVRVSLPLFGPERPAGTTAHRRVVLHDARLMEAGRYVIEVNVGTDLGTSVRHEVEVLTPEAPSDREAARAMARAIRATTDRKYWEGLNVSDVDVLLNALREADGYAPAEALAALIAFEAAALSASWAESDRPGADSVAARHADTALRFAGRYLAQHPAGTFAPKAARARTLALSRRNARSPSVVGTCEGRRFRVALAEPGPHRLVGIGTGERVDTSVSGEVEFDAPPEAAHLMRDGEIIAVALPDGSSCRLDIGLSLPPID